MGGTFDPVHNGHVAVARELRVRFSLDEVRLVTACVPPHRSVPAASAAHRYAMVTLATLDADGLISDPQEIEAGGTSFTIDTIGRLKRQFPAANLHFITGIDAFRDIASWKDYRRLLTACHFLVTSRPGTDLELPKLPDEARARVVHLGRGRPATTDPQPPQIFVCEIEPVPVSATDIRRAAARGEPLDAWVPPGVARYIRKLGLYSAADGHAR